MTKWYRYNYSFDEFEYRINVYKENDNWIAELANFHEDESNILATHPKKNRAIQLLRNQVESGLDFEKFIKLDKQKFDIFLNIPDILKNLKHGVGYHISNNTNSVSIGEYGLLPNYVKDNEVIEASILIDHYRPIDLINNIHRSCSVYFYPEFDNCNFTRDRKNVDLWAIDVEKLDKECMRVGSQGIGGFCFAISFAQEFKEENLRIKNIKEANMFAKKYWKYSCTVDDFINQTDTYKTIDKNWGLDEVIYSNFIPPCFLKKIGSWDSDGIFTITDSFSDYVIGENFIETINKYQQVRVSEYS